MKVSISLPDEDISFLDTYSADQRLGSRSAAVHRAVRLLRAAELGSEYEEAWAEWQSSGQGRDWESTVADGMGD